MAYVCAEYKTDERVLALAVHVVGVSTHMCACVCVCVCVGASTQKHHHIKTQSQIYISRFFGRSAGRQKNYIGRQAGR